MLLVSNRKIAQLADVHVTVALLIQLWVVRVQHCHVDDKCAGDTIASVMCLSSSSSSK